MKKGTSIKVSLMILFVVGMVCMIGVVSAGTTLNVHTLPNHLVSVDIVNPEDLTSKEHFVGNSSSDGKYTVQASTTGKFAVIFVLSKDQKFVVRPITLGNFTGGGTLEFELEPGSVKQLNIPEVSEPEIASCTENWTCGEWTDCSEGTQTRTCTDSNNCGTSKNKPAISQECEEPKNALTGFVVGVKDKVLDINEKIKWSYLLYFVLAIVAFGGVILFITKFKGKIKSFKDNSVHILKRDHNEGEGGVVITRADEKRLETVEESLKRAQEEIEAIKNKKNELSEAERQYKEAKKKLEELKGSAD